MLQPLTRRVAALMRPLRATFLVYGAFAVLVAAFGAAFVARTVLGPFQRFVRYMRSGAAAEQRQGRFDADHEALEVRTLNESFNQLMDSLAGKRRELEERTAELAAANVVLTDEISERTRVEQALRESEAQLRQSQKLEAIGTLAGGIAHDFNNLITVISGYTQLALMRAEQGQSGGRRSPAGRRRVGPRGESHAPAARVQPQAGAAADGARPRRRRRRHRADAAAHHRRAHRAAHRVATTPLARVRADRGQLEQVLLNLAVNARDAMPAGGTLTIATRNVVDARPAPSAVRARRDATPAPA